MTLRLARVSSDHYIAFPVLAPGTWHFTVGCVIDGRVRSFSLERVLTG
jgi:hypothetical protein